MPENAAIEVDGISVVGRLGSLRYPRSRGARRPDPQQPEADARSMARVSVAKHTSLPWLLMRRALRNLLAHINASPLVRWRFFTPHTDRPVIAPQDLRTADGTRANEIYSGRFAFAGKIVI